MAKRYIDADALEKFIRDTRAKMKPENYNSADAFHTMDGALLNMEQMVHALPAADVRENVKGEWIERRNGQYECSVCGETFCIPYIDNKNFCMSCGADMREEEA